MTLRDLAHAKINLSLRVLARETGGFHQIETLFCALELADEIEVSDGPDVQLTVHAPPEEPESAQDIPRGADNHAWRAAKLFVDRTGIRGAHISLTKRIPHGAGLGGGSSDAAAVLRTLNALHDNVLGADELLELGAQIGSDVPFFVSGAALALAWGRGGRLLPLAPLPSLPVLLVMPQTRMSTADAYHSLAVSRDASYTAPPGIVLSHGATWNDVAACAVNDFEAVTFQSIPVLAEILQALRDSGALLARMTGTGSVLFGVYADSATAEAARVRIEADGYNVWLTRNLGLRTPGGGFEPPLADPKTAVLPLNDPGSLRPR